MTLTPQDIQSKQFHVRFRGFDVDEVDDFLEKIAEDFLTMIQENKQLKDRLDETGKELSSYRNQEKTFQQAIMSAQQIAEEMKNKSQTEAESILEQAKEESTQLLDEANKEITELEKQVDELKAMRGKIRSELENILNAHLARLNDIFGNESSAPPLEVESPEEATETEATIAFESPSPTQPEDNPRPAEQPAENSENPEVHALEDDAFTDPTTTRAEEEAYTDPTATDTAAENDNPDEDLSDLYTKIDLPEDMSITPDNELGDEDDEATFSLEHDLQEEESSIPDLDGEILFNLEDPLDDLEGTDDANEKK